jgi:hypothetical protein
MDTKNIFTSKTFWLAVTTGALAIIQIVGAPDNPLSLEPETFAKVMTVGSILAIVVRKFTCRPVDIAPKGTDE